LIGLQLPIKTSGILRNLKTGLGDTFQVYISLKTFTIFHLGGPEGAGAGPDQNISKTAKRTILREKFRRNSSSGLGYIHAVVHACALQCRPTAKRAIGPGPPSCCGPPTDATNFLLFIFCQQHFVPHQPKCSPVS